MPNSESRLNDLREPLALLSDERLAEAERADLTAMHFKEPVAKLRILRRLGEAFAQEYEDELPQNVAQNVRALITALPPFVDQMIAFDVEDANAGQIRGSLISQVSEHFNQMVNSYRIHIRGHVDVAAAVERVEAAESRASTLLSEAEQVTERSKELISRVETLAAEMAAGNLSSYYEGQAEKHRVASKWFLITAGASALLVAVLAVVLFVTIEERPSSEWTAYVRDLGVRVFVLGLGLYVVSFMVKSYRANQHLLVVNQHKANALKTFRLFQESLSGEGSTRDLITAELVKAVFSADETGFLDHTPDRTVVEGQSGLLALLAQQTKS